MRFLAEVSGVIRRNLEYNNYVWHNIRRIGNCREGLQCTYMKEYLIGFNSIDVIKKLLARQGV